MLYIQSPGVANQYKMNQAVPFTATTSYDYRLSYYVAGDTPTVVPFLNGSSGTGPDVVTGVKGVAVPTDPPPTPLIQITALPPATALPLAVLPKLPYHRQLNVLYLVPLFIALGVVLGAIIAVVLLKWRERHLLRTPSCLPGPPYVPPENDVEDRLLVHGYPSMEQVSLFAAVTPSKFTIHGSRYTPKRASAWKTHSRSSQPTYTETIIPSSDGERFTVVTEADPFLAISPVVAPGLKNDVSLPQIRVSPSLPETSPGDQYNAQDNLPKPFRRSMFDVLKLKSYRRVPTTCKEYDLKSGEEPADKTPRSGVRRVGSLKTTVAEDNRSRGVHHSVGDGFATSNAEDSLGLFGSWGEIQDLADVPGSSPKQMLPIKQDMASSPEKMKQPRKVTPFTSESKVSVEEAAPSVGEPANTNKEDEEERHPDIYTQAPQRRRSRTPRKIPAADGASRRSSTHVSVLPLSPPSLMSPPLEKSLFFTSPLHSSVSLANSMNVLVTSHSSPRHQVEKTPELSLFPLPSSKRRAPKRLRTKRPQPPLPYPPYPDDIHSQTPLRGPSVSADTKNRSVSPGSPRAKGRSTSATLRDSTTGIWSLGSLSQTGLAIALASSSSSDMLHKVNDIVAQGYTKKRTSQGGGHDHAAARLPPDIV